MKSDLGQSPLPSIGVLVMVQELKFRFRHTDSLLDLIQQALNLLLDFCWGQISHENVIFLMLDGFVRASQRREPIFQCLGTTQSTHAIKLMASQEAPVVSPKFPEKRPAFAAFSAVSLALPPAICPRQI